MSRNIDEYWQCQTCFRHFPSDKELRQHIEAFQSRTQHLSSHLQRLFSQIQVLFAEIQECSAHSSPKLSNEEDCGASDTSSAADLDNDGGDGHEKLFCVHEECDGKPKTSFKTWKDLVRHYTIHVQCRETCGFCGIDIDRARKYVTHFDSCKSRKEGERSHQFLSKEKNAIERRRTLRDRASKELELKRFTIANTSDDAVSPQETNSRKRAREVADADPEHLHQYRKQRTAEETGGDATVMINSDTSYQAPRIEDAARGICLSYFSRCLANVSYRNRSTCSF
ncbi:hypothetical protein BKA61DRAFT_80542 [Leptodontidium sp. MPI-SDFR-AT-0119]|nr:hypothetical protein BKA61DRAFT_80542 [Leptodontidium sp. MPI-SDFR-AT-0119]